MSCSIDVLRPTSCHGAPTVLPRRPERMTGPTTGYPALDPAKIYRTYVGSNELSPFHHCYANEDTVLRIAVGRFFVHYNGVDPAEGYWAIRRDAALFDVPERPVEISGPDAVPFLERMLARGIADLKEGRGRYTVACNHHGGLFMDGILFRLAENRFWYVHADGDWDTWLLAHKAGFDVTLSDPRSRVLQLQGPKSFDIVHAATEGAVDEDMGYFHSGFFTMGGQEVFVSRTGWSGELGYEIYTRGDATDCPRLWNHLMDAGAPRGMVFGSMLSMNIRRIEAGILDNGSDFDNSMTPFEAGLDRYVDLDKDGFIGREALLDSRRGNRLYGLRCNDLIPGAGNSIMRGGQQVGFVTTGARSPYLEVGIGYVRFDTPGDWPGETLIMQAANGETARCDIVELPFYDRERHLPRAKPAPAKGRLDGL